MNPLLKIITLLIILTLFIWIVSFRLMENLPWQFAFLLVLIASGMLRFGLRKWFNELKLILPFILTMLIVYVLIGLITAKMRYWLIYGLLRSLNFINTMFFIQLTLSYISINDIIALPLSIDAKKHLILGRALFSHALLQIGNIEFHLRLLHEFQKPRLSLRLWFALRLQQSFAIIIMLLRESKLKGELIDNRIRHCYIINNRENP
ncbi:MAG: hypothetical protein R6V77_03370 [Candidatus Cloacimonadaceae bacterium]